jgi:mannose-6-phosphate isomerase
MSADPQDVPRRVDKPWGYEIWWAHTERYAGKILHIQAGAKLSLQYHERKNETSYLVRGRLALTKGPDENSMSTREITPGESWRNRPGELHTIEALEDSGACRDRQAEPRFRPVGRHCVPPGHM